MSHLLAYQLQLCPVSLPLMLSPLAYQLPVYLALLSLLLLAYPVLLSLILPLMLSPLTFSSNFASLAASNAVSARFSVATLSSLAASNAASARLSAAKRSSRSSLLRSPVRCQSLILHKFNHQRCYVWNLCHCNIRCSPHSCGHRLRCDHRCSYIMCWHTRCKNIMCRHIRCRHSVSSFSRQFQCCL